MCRKDLPLSEEETLNCLLAHKNIPRDIIDIVVTGSKRYENSRTSAKGCILGGEKERETETSIKLRVEDSNHYC